MKNYLLIVLLVSVSLMACSKKESVYLDDHNGRITDLERRAALNDELDASQSSLIALNSSAIAELDSRVSTLESDVNLLRDDLTSETSLREAADTAEELARIAGDADNAQALQDAVDAQSAVNDSLDSRINTLNTKLAQEQFSRIAGDILLSHLLAQETAARVAGDFSLAASLATSIAQQNVKNTQLQNSINAVQANLNTEVAARAAADLALKALLQGQLQAAISAQATVNASLASSVSHVQSQLNTAMFLQSLVNFGLQAQITHNAQVSNMLSQSLATLTTRVSNAENAIDSLESQVSTLTSSVSTLQSTVASHDDAIADLYYQLSLVDTVEVFKCNSSSSTENLVKINGKFYGAMNRVTMQTVQVITGSSSQSYTTPSMCRKSDGSTSYPNSAGNCTPMSGPNASTLVPGQTIVVPAYTTANVQVVASVKIAFEGLADGSYVTTDGGPACSFSISDSGTSSTNLVPLN